MIFQYSKSNIELNCIREECLPLQDSMLETGQSLIPTCPTLRYAGVELQDISLGGFGADLFSSQTTYVRDLPYTGMANGFPGRHIFRIDEKILPGVCIRQVSSQDWKHCKVVQGPDWSQPSPGLCSGEWEHVGWEDGMIKMIKVKMMIIMIMI